MAQALSFLTPGRKDLGKPLAAPANKKRRPPSPHLSSSGRSVLAELGHSQIQNKPLLNGTIPGQADWTRLRPQRRAQRGNPDAVHFLPLSGILDYIGLSVFERWGRFFEGPCQLQIGPQPFPAGPAMPRPLLELHLVCGAPCKMPSVAMPPYHGDIPSKRGASTMGCQIRRFFAMAILPRRGLDAFVCVCWGGAAMAASCSGFPLDPIGEIIGHVADPSEGRTLRD